MSWCKWSVSGFRADLLNFCFLIIENKFSNPGYHNNKIIKYGEICGFMIWISNNKKQNKNEGR